MDKWRHGDASPRRARQVSLAAEVVRLLVAAHRDPYGSPQIAAVLRAAGWLVSENAVAALMRE